MGDRLVPNVPNRFLYSNDELNQEREQMLSSPQYQLIPIAAVQKRNELQLQPADAEEAFLNRVWSETDQAFYLEFDLEGMTKALLKHSDFYGYMIETNPDIAEQIAMGDVVRSTPRIQDINLKALQFHHKFILQLKYFISADQFLHNSTSILYEDAPYGTLERFVNESRDIDQLFPERLIFEFAYELFSALEYCHTELNVMHRAVNPRHVFMFQSATGQHYVKLGGLVFAKMPDTRAHTDTKNPMIAYCAPETISDKEQKDRVLSYYGYSSDVYSLGMVVHFMAQGIHPYGDCKSRSKLKRELENGRKPIFDQKVSSLMEELITRCTIIEKRNRDGRIYSLGLRPTASQVRTSLEEHEYKPTFI